MKRRNKGTNVNMILIGANCSKVILCSARHMAMGGMAHDGANESRASNELFKMLVIKLELVIKIRDQREYEDRSMCPGGRRVEDGKRAESCEQKRADLKGNSQK